MLSHSLIKSTVTNFAELSGAIVDHAHIDILSDIPFDECITISGVVDVTIASSTGATLVGTGATGLIALADGAEVTFIGVNFASGSADKNGGCVDVDSSSVTIDRSTFSDCFAFWSGGGIHLHDATAVVTSTAFEGDSADGHGGCLMVSSSGQVASSTTVRGSTFDGCSAGKFGGGCGVHNSSVNIYDNTFSNCYSGAVGGGLALLNAAATISASNFSRTSAVYYGGGLYAEHSRLSVAGTNFSHGLSGQKGGGMAIWGGSCNIMSTAFRSCTARAATDVEIDETSSGGGLMVYNARDTASYFDNLLFHDCAAVRGGGLLIEFSTVYITGANFFDCSASSRGVGVHCCVRSEGPGVIKSNWEEY